MTTVTHATAATGTDSGDGKISKNAWNEGHTVTGPLYGSSDPDGGDQGWFYLQQIGGSGDAGRFLFVNVGTLAVPDWRPVSGITNTGAASVTVKDTTNLIAVYGEGDDAALEVNVGPVGHVGADIITGTADPSAGAGLTAPAPALYLRDNSGVGELWLKVGGSDTQWTKIL